MGIVRTNITPLFGEMSEGQVSFDEMWAAYPRRVDKVGAMQVWARLSEPDKCAAFKALPMHIRSWEMESRGKHLIPHLQTWLSRRRFEDEIELPEVDAAPWWKSDAGVLDKGKSLGMIPRPGEEMRQFRERVMAKMKEAA